MRKTIHAQVVAKAVSFPDQIEIYYQPTDKSGMRLGETFYKEGPLTWEQVKHRFWIDIRYAAECEKYFAEGNAALIRRHEDLEGNWIDPGDPDYKDSAPSN
jgi:hypothetical protein